MGDGLREFAKKAAAALAASAEPPPPPEREYRGVRIRDSKKFSAEIRDPSDSGRLWLGTYDTKEEAACAYDAAARTLQQDNAKPNLPEPPEDKEKRAAIVLAHVAELKRKREEKMHQEAQHKVEAAEEAVAAASHATSAVPPPPPAPAPTGDASASHISQSTGTGGDASASLIAPAPEGGESMPSLPQPVPAGDGEEDATAARKKKKKLQGEASGTKKKGCKPSLPKPKKKEAEVVVMDAAGPVVSTASSGSQPTPSPAHGASASQSAPTPAGDADTFHSHSAPTPAGEASASQQVVAPVLAPVVPLASNVPPHAIAVAAPPVFHLQPSPAAPAARAVAPTSSLPALAPVANASTLHVRPIFAPAPLNTHFPNTMAPPPGFHLPPAPTAPAATTPQTQASLDQHLAALISLAQLQALWNGRAAAVRPHLVPGQPARPASAAGPSSSHQPPPPLATAATNTSAAFHPSVVPGTAPHQSCAAMYNLPAHSTAGSTREMLVGGVPNNPPAILGGPPEFRTTGSVTDANASSSSSHTLSQAALQDLFRRLEELEARGGLGGAGGGDPTAGAQD